MSKPFAVFDIDGTLIRWQLFHAVADALAKRGHIDSTTYQTVREARMLWKRREHEESFKDYEKRLVNAYESLLGQLTVSQFQEAAEAVFEEYKDQTYTYTRRLIKDLKAQGYLLFAISGSQQEIIEKLAGYYGFDDCVGSIYEHEGEHFTGIKQLALGKKDEVLHGLVEKHGASWEDSISVGDSAGDIAMLELVEQPIAFNPEKALFTHAKAEGWQIVLERKNMIYTLEPQDGSYVLAQTDGR